MRYRCFFPSRLIYKTPTFMWRSELGYRISLISGISFGIQTNDESRNFDSFPSQARHRRLAMRHDETITWQLGKFPPNPKDRGYCPILYAL
jgi:hypothetical protein